MGPNFSIKIDLLSVLRIFMVIGSLIFISAVQDGYGQVIFVAADGNDQAVGTKSSPVKSIDAAIKKVNSSNEPNGFVYLREGTYRIDKTIQINNSKKQIKISSYNNELVTISGGNMIEPEKFKLVSDNVINERLNKKARGNVYMVNLRDIGINDLGAMQRTGYGERHLPSPIELFLNDTPLVIARWPNDILLQVGKVIQKGEKNSVKNDGKLPVFQYGYSRPEHWRDANSAWISGIFNKGWASIDSRVKSIDLIKKQITLDDKISYGLVTNLSNGITVPKGNINGYFFYNILEELDTAGEWYLDRRDCNLYVWPVGGLKNASIEVSMMDDPFLKITNSSNLTIEDIVFSCSRGIMMQIEKSNDISIDKCKFINAGMSAIRTSLCNNLKITNSSLANSGAGSIYLSGGDRKTLTPSNNLVENCEFVNYCRRYKGYAPAINIAGVGNTIKNCYIHDAEGQAIIFYGNNNKIINNVISNVSYGFSDIGAIYTGRDPSAAGTIIQNNYFSNIRGKNRNNMVAAVYIDDGSGGQIITDNFFYQSGSLNASGLGAIHINGGANNTINNNVFMDCGKGLSNSYWTDEQWKNFISSKDAQDKLLKSVNIESDLYLKQYPYLKDILDGQKAKPRLSNVNNTILINTKDLATGKGFKATNTLTYDNTSSFSFSKDNLNAPRIVKYPNATKSLKGWKPIDFDSIGIKKNK